MGDATYNIKTSVGKFRVEKSRSFNPDGSLNYHLLKIGGEKFCIVYSFFDNSDIAKLEWVITEDGGCELTGVKIKGEKTIHLFNLSVAILKKYGNFKIMYFLDNSSFPCELPNGGISRISTNKYYLLFHRKTWYEAKLNAYPKYSYDNEPYKKIKELFNDPERKPEKFSFKNEELTTILTPIFKSSNTWAEFFDKIYPMENICQIIYPWYIDAVMNIKAPYKLPEEWAIDINDTIPVIPYKVVKIGSGTRKSRKSLPEFYYEQNYYVPHYDDIQKFKYIK